LIAVDVTSFEQWVTTNSKHPIARCSVSDAVDALGISVGTHVHAFLAVMAASDKPVVSHSLLVGPNADKALQLDREVQNVTQAGGDKQQALAASPATGCAMVMTLAQQASGFNPLGPTAAGNVAGFLSFVNQLVLCPIFSTVVSDQVAPTMSDNWNSVVDQIAAYYVGLAPAQIDEIRAGLWRLAQAASSTPSTSQTEDIFVQSTLNAGDQLVLYMYQSLIRMQTNVESGGKHSPDTVTNNASLALWRTILRFDSDRWPAYAPVIMSQTTASLESWLQNTTTPQGPLPVRWTI
jgi:hypothetical protein